MIRFEWFFVGVFFSSKRDGKSMRATGLFRGMGCKYCLLTTVGLLVRVYWVRPGQLVPVGSESNDKTNLLLVELKLHTFHPSQIQTDPLTDVLSWSVPAKLLPLPTPPRRSIRPRLAIDPRNPPGNFRQWLIPQTGRNITDPLH